MLEVTINFLDGTTRKVVTDCCDVEQNWIVFYSYPSQGGPLRERLRVAVSIVASLETKPC